MCAISRKRRNVSTAHHLQPRGKAACQQETTDIAHNASQLLLTVESDQPFENSSQSGPDVGETETADIAHNASQLSLTVESDQPFENSSQSGPDVNADEYVGEAETTDIAHNASQLLLTVESDQPFENSSQSTTTVHIRPSMHKKKVTYLLCHIFFIFVIVVIFCLCTMHTVSTILLPVSGCHPFVVYNWLVIVCILHSGLMMVFYYRAKPSGVRYCQDKLSVCPSVTFRYRDHTG